MFPSRDVGAAGEGVVLPGRSQRDLSEEDGTEPEAQPSCGLSVHIVVILLFVVVPSARTRHLI